MPTLAKLSVAVLIAGWTTSSAAFSGSRLTDEVFRDYCHRNRRNRSVELFGKPAIGSTLYVPTHLLDAGQNRYSFEKMLKALKKAQSSKSGNYYDRDLQQWVFGYDGGRSMYPIEKRLVGIRYRAADGAYRFHIVDGHHRALISTYRGAPTVPMLLIGADWDDLSVDDFRRVISTEPHHFAHWLDFQGTPVRPVDLCDMVNDPYLTLARMLLRRVDITRDPLNPFELRLHNDRGADKFVVIKINDDIPFLEFEIADVLRRHGVIFTASDVLAGLNKKRMMEFQRILKAEVRRPGSRLAHLCLLPRPVHAHEVDFPRVIAKHVAEVGCEYKLDHLARGDD